MNIGCHGQARAFPGVAFWHCYRSSCCPGGGMERSVYLAILEKVRLPFSAWPHFYAISRLFGVSFDTVFSIYSLEVTKHVKSHNHELKTVIPAHAQRYLSGVDALQLAFELNFPPCVLMRRLLEQLQPGLTKERITRVLREPDKLAAVFTPEALQRLEAIAAAAGGTDGSDGGPALEFQQRLLQRLEQDVRACVACDRCYSPESDRMRHDAGQEYEQRLNESLRAAGVAFWTEEQLRARGFHKTPDARLQVPIAVQGRIITWVDSKATFGDDKLHRLQTMEQCERYVNRFGPGLVIYWHGYIADLNHDPNVLLMDRFPAPHEIVQLPCLPLTLAPALPAQLAAPGAVQEGSHGSIAADAALDGVLHRTPVRGQAAQQQRHEEQQQPQLSLGQQVVHTPVRH